MIGRPTSTTRMGTRFPYTTLFLSIFKRGNHRARKGVALVLIVTLMILGLVFKNTIMVSARGGETIHAEFAQSYGLVDGVTKVKLAGLVVGVVTGVEHTDKGTAMVAMKVDREALDSVGSTPTARIVPLTILGGQYSVELHRSEEHTSELQSLMRLPYAILCLKKQNK